MLRLVFLFGAGLREFAGVPEPPRALERAVRYRAFSWSAVERILAAQARPRSGWESLQAEAQDQLDEILRQSPVSTRSAAEYQALLEETVTHDETDEDDDPSA